MFFKPSLFRMPSNTFPLERRWDGIFFILNWNILVIVSLARVQRALNCVRYIAVLRYASWESSRSPNRSSSTGNFLVQFSSVGDVPNDGPSFLRFFSLNVEFVAVCCVCAASDGWIIPFNSIDFYTPHIFVPLFVKTKGKNLGASYWTLFVGLVSRERHPSRFFGCYLFKRTKESRKYRHSSENSASDEDGWSNRFPMTSLRADVHPFQSILYRIGLAKEFEWRWRRR